MPLALLDDAIREYERALALCPTFVDIRAELGDTLRESGDSRGAIRELEACGRRARFVAGRLKLGLSYYAAARRDDAVTEWQAALELDPANPARAHLPRPARHRPLPQE